MLPDPELLSVRSPALIAGFLPFARWLSRSYFRLRVEGAENIASGPALYVCNHNNGLAGPEILCTLTTLWEAHGPDAPLYALAHDFAMRHLRPFGAALGRFGAIRATQEHGLQALAAGCQLMVYPGGDLEAYRHSRRRDEIVFGPRAGFVRLAQRAGVPIVPVVAQGAHRSAYVFSEGVGLAKRMGLKRWARLERFPLALALPWGIAAGPWLPWLPLPLPIKLRFLPPVTVDPDADPALVRDAVRSSMQSALDAMARASRAPQR